jgi:hypothetical protein
MSQNKDVIDRIKALGNENSAHLEYLIPLLVAAVKQFDERLKAIEQRLDKQDEYRQEQNER